jgi:regulator of ribonuclease E activity RraA/HMG-CHA aldolase family protein
MSIRARKLGNAGAALNGYTRDTKAILNLAFPTFSWGSYRQHSAPHYKLIDSRVPAEIGVARVWPEPGTLVSIEPRVYIREHGAGARIEDDVLCASLRGLSA